MNRFRGINLNWQQMVILKRHWVICFPEVHTSVTKNKKLLFKLEPIVLNDIIYRNVAIELTDPLASHWSGFQAIYFIYMN
jgi:hypothetical protein